MARFDQPIGTLEERNAPKAWAGLWWDATGFGRGTVSTYTPKGQYHEGADLNLPNLADSGGAVYASADGVVERVGVYAGWTGLMVIIKHEADKVWTRYAHLKAPAIVAAGQLVKRGDKIGEIGDYGVPGAPEDHLHFAVARIDLGAIPADWPGADIVRLERDYIEPLAWINSHRTDPIVTKWTPTSPEGTRVRLSPDSSSPANILGVIPGGAVVDGLETSDKAWVRVKAKVPAAEIGDVVLKPSIISTFDAFAYRLYMKAAETTPPPPPPPQKPPVGRTVIGTHPALPFLPTNRRMGVHLLNMGFPEMKVYHDAKCPSFTCLNNVNAARECRATGAPVIYRHYIERDAPPPEVHLLNMGLGGGDAFLIMGINENDSIPGEDLERRFSWDRAFAEAVWKHFPLSFPVIGSFSMGVPRLEDPSVAARWRDTYGRFLNDNAHRVGLNYHCYSHKPAANYKPADAAVIAPRWLEMRMLLMAYDPNLGGLSSSVVCVGDESGVDVGGRGGFLGCGYDEADFLQWAADRMGLFEDFPQMYIHNIFQGRWDDARWASYNCRPYLGAMEKVWRGEIAPTQRLEERTVAGMRLLRYISAMDVDAGGTLPENWSPERKALHG